MFFFGETDLHRQALVVPHFRLMAHERAMIRAITSIERDHILLNRKFFSQTHELAHVALQQAIINYRSLLSLLTDEDIKESIVRQILLWKFGKRYFAECFWIRLRSIFKKQQKVTDKVKSIFVPVKILLDTLHPIKFAA